MGRRAFISMIVALLVATTPAAAFADGAGDNQYQDPLTAPSAPKKAKKKASTAPTSSTPAATTAPAASAAPASTAAPVSTSSTQQASAQTAAAPAPTLPRTGAPTDLIGLAGVALIASGAVLRRRTSTQ
jgi:LPXTG-motif cell wall-anchored protein